MSDANNMANSFNLFAIDLYKHLSGKDENSFFSPFSIALALTMVGMGTRNQTAEEMMRVLHVSLQESALARAVSGIMGEIRTSDREGKNKLHIANALWIKKGYSINPPFRTSIQENLSGNLFDVDFNLVEEVRKQINGWVSKQTQGKIPQLLAPGSPNVASVIVITNAIYFYGHWLKPFSESSTRDRPFFLLNGKEKNVTTMHGEKSFEYTEDGKVQYLELPYVGESLAMGIILPKKRSGLPALEKQLSLDYISNLIEDCQNRKVDAFIPRFKLEAMFDLAEILQQMGIKSAFQPSGADFSGITSDPAGIFISAVIHKAFVDVTEKGTEAAAATAVMMLPSCAPGKKEEPTPIFRADHPFVFFIRHTRLNAILFLGKVVFPG